MEGAERDLEDASPLQKALSAVIDDERLDSIFDRIGAEGRHDDDLRLRDLQDPSVSHEWLWALNPAHGDVIPRADYVTCVRLRLGATIIDDPMLCSYCNDALLGSSCVHASCCALGKSTKGHNDIRDGLMSLVHLADPSADIEVGDLIPSRPGLRPADILTQAAIPG